MRLLLARCPRCGFGRLAEDSDPEAGVDFERCLSCGMNRNYRDRVVFRVEPCRGECDKDELHGRERVMV